MKFDNSASDYLLGEKFSDSHEFKFTVSNDVLDTSLVDRYSMLEKLLKDKKVIHGGCVDHSIEQLTRNIQRNTWLHKRIDNVATRCLGVDINQEGISYIKESLGYQDMICCDMTEDTEPLILEDKWDYLLLGELVEHIDNPVAFLSAIRMKYRNNIDSVIVTVPNALKLKNIRRTYRNIERINTDHRFWFSPYTMAKILSSSGYKITEFFMVSSGHEPAPHPYKLKRWWRYRAQLKHPLLRDGIVMLASLEGD